MESYILEPTGKTPTIKFNISGVLEISGRSIPEDSIGFYKPAITWLEQYIKSPSKKTELTINLEYFNTSSSKCLIVFFQLLEKIHNSDNQVLVNWQYEEDNEDILEMGEGYSSNTKVPFKMVQI